MKPTGRVLVYTRVRPPKGPERKDGLVVTASATEVAVADKNDRDPRTFPCDGAFAMDASQEDVFEQVGQPILDSVLEGYNGCVLAYGQTGSGKTHTLLNPGESVADSGLVPRLAAALFFTIGQDVGSVYVVRVSFFQIYNEQVDDLLKPVGNHNLKIKPNEKGGMDVDGATQVRVSSPAALMQLFNQGRKNLIYAETRMNKSSSRSHAVFQLVVDRRPRILDGGGEGGADAAGAAGAAGSEDAEVETTQVTGKLTLVDLAGSERVKRSGADSDLSGVRFKEAVNINTSLLGLGSVMKALGDKAKFVPYRDSKLTQLLQDSLGGNCRTALVVCVSPAAADHSETTGALEFGQRAMKVAVHARVNAGKVLVDAERIAADLEEALRMRAQGGSGRINELEDNLKEAEARLADLAAEREANAAALREAEAKAQAEAAQLTEQQRLDAEAEKERLMGLMRDREAALRAATDALTGERAQLSKELGQRKALESRLEARELELAKEREKRQRVEGASDQMRSSLQQLQKREEELAAQLRQAKGELTRAAQASTSVEARLEQTEAEKAEAAHALAREAEAKASLQMRLAATQAELAHLQAVRKERAATLAALETQLSSAEADAADKASALAQLSALHDATVRESAEMSARAKAESDARLRELSEQHRRQLDEVQQERSALSERHARLVDAFDAANARRDAEAERLTAEKKALQDLKAASEDAARTQAEALQRDLAAERALRLEAMGRVDDALRPLAEDLAALREQHSKDAAAAAESSAALRAKLEAMRSAYDTLLDGLQVEQAQRSQAEGRADELAAALRVEEARRKHAEEVFQRTIEQKEALLAELADASEAGERQLRAALADHEEATRHLAELYAQAAAAERRAHGLDRRLRVIDGDLMAAQAARGALAEELSRLEERAVGSLAQAESERAAQLRTLVAEREAQEHALAKEKAKLEDERDELRDQLDMLAGEKHAEAQRYEEQRQRAAQRLRATEAEHEATISSLEGALRRNAEERRKALEEMEAESRSFEAAMARKEAELADLRGDLKAAQTSALRTLLLTGVSVTKHGRKGIPHRRHVRVSRDLQRLEWAKPGEGPGKASASVAAHEVVQIVARAPPAKKSVLGPLAALPETLAATISGGLSASTASASAASGGVRPATSAGVGEGLSGTAAASVGPYFLSIVTRERSVDLEFSSAEERDSWQRTWQAWLELAHETAAWSGRGGLAGVPDDDETAAGGAGGASGDSWVSRAAAGVMGRLGGSRAAAAPEAGGRGASATTPPSSGARALPAGAATAPPRTPLPGLPPPPQPSPGGSSAAAGDIAE